MTLRSVVLTLLLAMPALASAQAIDLGSDVTGYTRFLVYPHLQKGWDSMQRGDRDRAFAEFERARGLAPENAAVALQLVAAYRKFGEIGRAASLLREQLKYTPRDARLRTTLAELEAAAPPLPAPPAVKDSVASQPIAPRQERLPRPLAARPPSPARITQPDVTMQLQARFALALQAHRFDDAQREADSLLVRDGNNALLHDLSYKLVDAGATEQAMRVLLREYPFAAAAAAERDTLLQRLIPLIEEHRGTLDDDQLLLLRRPLDTPALRSRQGVLWADLQDCGAVRAVLGDMSAEYGHDDWMRLGGCSTAEDPEGARKAYAKAHTLRPGGSGSRALAYKAHASGDYRTALDAWRSVGAQRLSGDEVLAAVRTALAAGEPEQATTWLDEYRERGETIDHQYWSLVGQSHAGSDVAAALSAFERAVELHPELDDYLRLARLDPDPRRQVHWLEPAAALDRDNAETQAQLAYAYARSGLPASAMHAFERAAALNPDNVGVQIELGFGYWRAGRLADAQHALERAWHADSTNLIVARQLVYVHQRLKHNGAARQYAEQVLDTSSSFSEAATDGTVVAQADLRFGFQRLHEDLGRRVTLNLDGFSGTRVGTGTNASQAGRYRSYSQFEADIRLGNSPVRDGSTVSAYARVFTDGGDLRSALPSKNAMLGVGLRWKPWRSQVIYLAAEHQNGLDDESHRDVLLRASASFLNGGRYGDDWHPARSGWFSRNLYLDAAQYLETKHSAFTADYRTSYHRRVASDQTLEPYVHVQFNSAENRSFERDVRAGAGVRWNVWHGGTAYDAAPHKLSLGVECQQAFETYLSDRNGLFLTLGSRW